MNTSRQSASRWQARGIILAAIAVMVAAVFIGSRAQREASREGDEAITAAQRLLTSRIDMETGLRGFMLTGKEAFLEPFRSGLVAYRAAAADARDHQDDPEQESLLLAQDGLTTQWLGLAKSGISERRRGLDVSTAGLLTRKRLMDEFRRRNSEYIEAAREHSEDKQQEASRFVIVITGVLGLTGLLVGYLAVEGPAARRARRRRDIADFAEMLQFASSENEAHALVRTQLERTIPNTDAAVLTINNSENRLLPATDLPQDSPLAPKLRAAVPSACLSIRRGKEYVRREGPRPLIECEICGAEKGSAVCVPALVGGEIMGSVLVTRAAGELTDREARRVATTTSLAAPVLGNLRNLAIAETRAVTDSLTGLSNSRAATETLKVMAAFAGRSAQPLTAVLVDLDRFKKVNDTYGHQVGDEVLAAAATSLKGSLRASDFIARHGGEEFLVLLQGTSRDDGGRVAENMRRDLAHIRVPGFAARVTASLGVATIPDDAGESEGLLRAADEALYAAKGAGRDRVMLSGAGEPTEYTPSKEGSGNGAGAAASDPAPARADSDET